jgi:hypothetical protein
MQLNCVVQEGVQYQAYVDFVIEFGFIESDELLNSGKFQVLTAVRLIPSICKES